MSAISSRIVNDNALAGIILGQAVFAYLVGDATAAQARDFVNQHIDENMGTPLTAQEEADVQTMKATYDAIPGNDDLGKANYAIRVLEYSSMLHNGLITETFYDNKFGL